MKLGLAIEQVAHAERELADQLTTVGERHRTDHDVFHMTRTLAKKERAHIDALEPHARRYDTELAGIENAQPDNEGFRGPALLGDLRRLHLLAAGASLDWVALAQGAQAAKDSHLLATVTECHDQTLRTLKWTTYRLKEAAPQALTS